MLIPEAAQLVIQAAAMARGGDVFVLDMGEPVKIVDLARTMIEVAGPQLHDEANPEGDIEIKFVGLRDGEKLFEELLIGENVSTTAHDRIMRCDEYFPPRQYIEMELEVLRRSLEVGDAEDLIRRVMLLATPPKLPALITPGNRMSALVPQFSAGPQAK
jgi:FlaA1/EpsC-like NDP-sugar epimerase